MPVHTPSIFPSPSYKVLFKLLAPVLSSFPLRFLLKGCSSLSQKEPLSVPGPSLPPWGQAGTGAGEEVSHPSC